MKMHRSEVGNSSKNKYGNEWGNGKEIRSK
jgi:hypothetical protein